VSVKSTVTKKGQITIPKEVRQHLGVKPGDRVKFFVMRNGTVVLTRILPVAALKGILPAPANPVSIEDMDAGIAAAVAERDRRSREG
jgi:antitoxin PrlF